MQKPDPASIPTAPGVYLYKDARGRVIYVGKARVLRRRVLSYFRPDGLPAKTLAMLSHAATLDYLTTTTEKEALLLEASLIKKHRPHYNIVLRDDKQYVLFRCNLRHPFPRLEIVRQARRDGARYFGPFTSALAARETWKLLHRAFALRRCTDKAMKNRVRPCLYHFMGQCPAPCMGLVTPQEYNARVRQVCDLLEGRSAELLRRLQAGMEQAAEALEFERAALLRDQIRAVERTVERQAAVLPGGGDMDALGLAPGERGLALGLVFVRNGAVTDGRAFYWPGLSFEDAPELLWSFLSQYYSQVTPPPRVLLPWLPPDLEADPATAPHNAEPPTVALPDAPPDSAPDAALNVAPDAAPDAGPQPMPAQQAPSREDHAAAPTTPNAVPASAAAPTAAAAAVSATPAARAACSERELLEQTLSDRRNGPVRLVAPQNAGDNRLVDLAQGNAREEAHRQERGGAQDILARLGAALHLPGPPRRLECVDVSHTGGKQTRVGLVVFEDGRPERGQYRNYAMPDSGDDYATLHAWVARRLESGPPWPDLLLIDGGRGQLHTVQRALREAGRAALFPLAAIAKARDDAGHADRRAGNIADRIFTPERVNPLPLREGSPELLFLQNVRDTAHRFVIGRHRRARRGAALSGELMRLPGIGPATARLLWDHFGSVEAMRAASLDDLRRLPGIGPAKAALLLQKLADLQ
ncbi:excinuclease ABC subunit UvrC [Desulfovibrio legallii]|uniref:UvrABC system protein C n=1 Tax=Desulfovibrio legallii TaxID=571438 RepID=A0A1G7NR61_9BACT|nr:excinuclease ABC subunit UvrC [Desulfovibrio legallii]SDF76451.1 Excinuclease ABC subunit C [Desulfovibrio legallii]